MGWWEFLERTKWDKGYNGRLVHSRVLFLTAIGKSWSTFWFSGNWCSTSGVGSNIITLFAGIRLEAWTYLGLGAGPYFLNYVLPLPYLVWSRVTLSYTGDITGGKVGDTGDETGVKVSVFGMGLVTWWDWVYDTCRIDDERDEDGKSSRKKSLSSMINVSLWR